jgi:hypothetical protein
MHFTRPHDGVDLNTTHSLRSFAIVLSAAVSACAPSQSATSMSVAPDQTLIAVSSEWWHAITFGDTAYLRDHTSARIKLTTSGGQQFDSSSLIVDVATHRPKPSAFAAPENARVIYSTPLTVIVESTIKEGTQGGANEYRYLTVFGREEAKWLVVAAQSTRVLSLTPRVAPTAVEDVTPYEGQYRGGGGGLLRVVKRGAVLVLIDPAGAETVLEPIGPGMFEMPRLYDGIAIVRFVFTRDDHGAVSSLSRLIYSSVTTWPRAR